LKLLNIYEGRIKSMHNTPCKVAIFSDGKEIKVFQKEFFINQYGLTNWGRNVILEGYNSIKKIKDSLNSAGFTVCN